MARLQRHGHQVDTQHDASGRTESLRTLQVAFGLDFKDRVLTAAQTVESIITVCIGRGRCDDATGRVTQLDRDTFDPDLTGIANAVLISVDIHRSR